MTLPDSFLDEYARRSRASAQEMYDALAGYCESPIETAFACAFYLAAKEMGDVVIGPPGGRGVFCIQFQAPVLSYRADFLICENSDTPAFIVVECDGHDFHERTKEQAERDRRRDREMQSAGYRVFRFTGREIYRDAFKCADEVVSEAIRTSGRGRL
jgi:very-short-patch-repair endonuclease